MAGFVDTGDAVAPVIVTPQARHRAVRDQKVGYAGETKRVGQHNIYPKPVVKTATREALFSRAAVA
jgi:hypothetical protein